MYEFEHPGQPTTLRVGGFKTYFNDSCLDDLLTDKDGKFHTLATSGRGILSRNIPLLELPNTNGARERKYTYPPRNIAVKFLISDRTNEGFRSRLNELNRLLLGERKKLQFSDEQAYFWATFQTADLPEEISNTLVGTLNFLCSDPAKYREKHELQLTRTFANYEINGYSQSTWTSRTVFSAETVNFTLENEKGGKIVLNYTFGENDVLEIDYEKRLIKLNGVARMPLLSLDSNWFNLQPGVNRLRASHATTVTYRETYY
ncbi:hypothetical protein CHH77_02350 [Shouchella clausii]|uniref:distal tail protein Dit n=1 Tax=Shouchella clausii TaxID=79880 RepID=UPI000BA696D8|nr:distal tail protein Dit [Shouchella clausii]PAE84979.1 hypothetical protein CHH77_02350 [Shouchella clausii]